MRRRRELFVPAIVLDRESNVPLQRQIYRQIARAIKRGAARGGAQLPSSRVLARLLGVSRNTVLAAYDDLASDGMICGERGAGTRVSGSAPRRTAWFGLQHVIRAASYPGRVLPLDDPDGNPLYILH